MRRALVVGRTERKRGRHRWLAVLPAALVLGVAVRVVASDPVGYGVPFWPFATPSDRAEDRVMVELTTTARALRSLDAVPRAITRGDDVEVLQSREDAGRLWLRVRLRVPDGVRCREVGVTDARVTSRRVDC
ncbi:hypothetical protein [Saccharothrix syringae]|uniref:Uncharacterized protein n=1 Tax=Saccharothrix syringae TaxID=103733 RepID=A0A5Q0HAI8_SACSY|nr:hypothetical protein [Saccharothrix syringae]QFZ23256.1 hypothetical protein EKG83_42675 [Saccharothrix syringae]